MKVDYIIVGFGLAGLAFAEELSKQNKSFVVYEDNSQNSSLVAGGMYNPVILKRFTPVWNAAEQLSVAIPFYKKLEKKLHHIYNHKIDIYRIFKSIEEQNNWFIASDKILLQDYMDPNLVKNNNNSIHAPFSFGKLRHTGRIEVNTLISDYRALMARKNVLKEEKFEHNKIKFADDHIEYDGYNVTNIVFCEGYGIKKNPFFNKLPMKEAKGELITISAPDLKIDYLLKGPVFVMPLGNDLYKVGATFNWKDKTNIPTSIGKEELIKKLNSFIKCDYDIVSHSAGIRPAIVDRRPLLGVHSKYKRLAILNGLGTRGVMIAPLMAKKLYQYLENSISLDKEISIERFN
jgi:glycine/D-amino acid oxidase-like deaminating enzyme